jgi:PadR family transcriptional regulator, regulatory protein PadR
MARFTIDLQFVRSIIAGVNEFPRLSGTERLILELLDAEGELFGLQMVELSGGRLKRGTVYVTLGRMQEKGFLESRRETQAPGAIGLPRRLYRPTGHGARVLAAWRLAEQMMKAHPQEA